VQEETTGQDLAKMLWLKSNTSEVWVERRKHFVNSLAAMSMVGYILGLGDRHPSNLMIDRVSGRVVHIDFGDCFEITKHRAKYPEIIPFRLTRMLTNCMGVGGLNGTFQMNCEKVMGVLRENRDSVMAMLEAFVYDPLISWRLLNQNADELGAATTLPDDSHAGAAASSAAKKNGLEAGEEAGSDDTSSDGMQKINKTTSAELRSDGGGGGPSSPHPGEDDNELSLMLGDVLSSQKRAGLPVAGSVPQALNLRRGNSADAFAAEDEAPLQENLNARALEVINRVQAKLTGRDFQKPPCPAPAACPAAHQQELLLFDDEIMTVEQQVERLILEATSEENLCQLFNGWCALW
jgi:serine/threonine-protein kinase mTOR